MERYWVIATFAALSCSTALPVISIAAGDETPVFGVVRGDDAPTSVGFSVGSGSVSTIRKEVGQLRTLVDRHCSGLLEGSRCAVFRKRYHLKSQDLDRVLARQKISRFGPGN